MHSNIFDRLSFWSLSIVVILLPVFCLPFTNIPVEISKGLLLVLGLTACVIFWAIARFSDGKIILPKSYLLVSGFGISLVFLLSALFSVSPQVSLFGVMFDIGSFWFIFSAFVLMLMSSIVFRTREQVKTVLMGTILSSAFVLIFQIAYLFIPKFLSLGILTGQTSNILGSWNALGLFAGFAFLMFLLVVEFFPVSKNRKIMLEVFMLFSILMAVVVNFPLVWILLGISGLVIFVYKVSTTMQVNEGENNKKYFPVIPFLVMMISVLFLISPQFISSIFPSKLQIPNSEISLSLGTTMSITKDVMAKNPLLGVGPNRFDEAWSMYKEKSINNTQFWDVSFIAGYGLLPTLVATTGGLGMLSWLLFIVLFLYIGIRSMFSGIKNGINWEIMAFFVLSLYLLIASFFYFTGAAMFLLAFVFSGVFIGLVSSSSNKEISLSFLDDHRQSFFSILILVLLVVSSVIVSFKYIERFTSFSYFGKALSASTVPIAEDYMVKALSLYGSDLYLRTYAQIDLVKLNSLVNKEAATLTDVEKADIQKTLEQAVISAQLATTYNPSNYVNFQVLGSVYQAVGALGVKDAYTKAMEAYQTASGLNPLNPGIKVAMAGVSFDDKKVKEAKDYANEALSLKPDYVDALVTLSQIAKSEGDNNAALNYAQSALSFLPDNKNLIDYVNFLKNSSAPAPATSSSSTTPKKP